MNKRGQVILYALMVGVVIIILAIALAFPTRQAADTSMNASTEDAQGLDCQNTSISNFDKITCETTDLIPFYFIGSLIMIGGIWLTSKILVP